MNVDNDGIEFGGGGEGNRDEDKVVVRDKWTEGEC